MIPGRRDHRSAAPLLDGTPLAVGLTALIALEDRWTASRQDGPGAHTHLRVLLAEAGSVVFHRPEGDLAFAAGGLALLPPGWRYRDRTIPAAWRCRGLLLDGPWIQGLDLGGAALISERPPAGVFQAVAEAVTAVLDLRPGWAWSVLAALGGIGVWRKAITAPTTLCDRAEALLRSDPDRPWTVPELAQALGLGLSAFAHRFRAENGTAPGLWLRRRRIARAQALLGHLSPKQAAERLGFADQFHFSRSFRQIVGVPPSVWRLQQGGRLV